MDLNLVPCHFRALAEEFKYFYVRAIFHIYTQKLLFVPFFYRAKHFQSISSH